MKTITYDETKWELVPIKGSGKGWPFCECSYGRCPPCGRKLADISKPSELVHLGWVNTNPTHPEDHYSKFALSGWVEVFGAPK